MNAGFRLFAVLLAVMAFASEAAADAVHLKNGRIYYGKIVGQDGTRVFLRNSRERKSISKKRIKQIIYGVKRPTNSRRRVRRAARADSKPVKTAPPTKTAPAVRVVEARDVQWRSAVLPGWGQYHGGDAETAGLFAGVFLAAALGSFQLQAGFDDRRREYRDSARFTALLSPAAATGLLERGAWAGLILRTESLRDRMRRSALYNDLGSTILLGAYLWNLWDAFQFPGTGTRVSIGPKSSRFVLGAMPGGAELSFTARF